MFHNLFPVHRSALTYLVGRGFLDDSLTGKIERFFAGMIWDEGEGRGLLPRTSAGKLVPREVRDAAPGVILEIDGAPGVVVSNVAFNRRHVLGSLAVVPLIDGRKAAGADRVAVGSLVTAPEFLKICQPFEGVHPIRPTGQRLEADALERLIAQVRELLALGAETPTLGALSAPDGRAMNEAEHPCLFSSRTRPRTGGAPRQVPLVAGGTESREFDGSRPRVSGVRLFCRRAA